MGQKEKLLKRGGELIHLSFIENITKKCILVSNVRAYGKILLQVKSFFYL